jgi:hypothetical protein
MCMTYPFRTSRLPSQNGVQVASPLGVAPSAREVASTTANVLEEYAWCLVRNFRPPSYAHLGLPGGIASRSARIASWGPGRRSPTPGSGLLLAAAGGLLISVGGDRRRPHPRPRSRSLTTIAGKDVWRAWRRGQTGEDVLRTAVETHEEQWLRSSYRASAVRDSAPSAAASTVGSRR